MQYPEIESAIHNFCALMRSQRLPLSFSIIQACDQMVTEQVCTRNFSVSTGWIMKVLRRTDIRLFLWLHTKGISLLPPDHSGRVQEIRDVSKDYSLQNVYNIDESGLFTRMGPIQSYLMPNVMRTCVCGTDLQKHKNQVTTVYSTNTDESHKLCMR